MMMASTNKPRRVQHHVEVTGRRNSLWKGTLRLLGSVSHGSPHFKDDSDAPTDVSSRSFNNDDIVYSNKSQGVFTLFQVGDGSDTDPDGIPLRYLKMANNDRQLALQAVQKTVAWREEQGINEMLNDPHVNFDICKQVVPHIFIGRDVQGHVVYVQQPALFNMEQVKANGLTFDDLLHHSIYIQEYLWQIIEADNANATITSIIDAGDMRLAQLSKRDQVQFLQKMASTFDAHFPMRAHKTLVVNAPKWFHLLYKLIKPILRESTTDMIEICTKGKHQDAILLEHLGQETSKSLPAFCWSNGKSKATTTASVPVKPQMEQDLRDFVVSRLNANGSTMAPVIVP